MLKVKLPYLDNAIITNQRDRNSEYGKVSNVKFKLENQGVYSVLCTSFLCLYCIYYICDYPNLLLTSFPRNDLVNVLWLNRLFNLCVFIWGSSLYTLIKLVRIEFA